MGSGASRGAHRLRHGGRLRRTAGAGAGGAGAYSAPGTPRVTPDSLVALACLLLVPLAALGLSLMNCGLSRSRNAAHAMTSSLMAIAVAAAAYFVCGFSWHGYSGLPVYVLRTGGKEWDWIAAMPFFLRKLPLEGSAAPLGALLG